MSTAFAAIERDNQVQASCNLRIPSDFSAFGAMPLLIGSQNASKLACRSFIFSHVAASAGIFLNSGV